MVDTCMAKTNLNGLGGKDYVISNNPLETRQALSQPSGIVKIAIPNGHLEEHLKYILNSQPFYGDINWEDVFKAEYNPQFRYSNGGIPFNENAEQGVIYPPVIFRPQDIPTDLARGKLSVGLAGRDLVINQLDLPYACFCDRRELIHALEKHNLMYQLDLKYRPTRIVAATQDDEESVEDWVKPNPDGLEILTELVFLTKEFLAHLATQGGYSLDITLNIPPLTRQVKVGEGDGRKIMIQHSHGKTERRAKALETRLVEICESGDELEYRGFRPLTIVGKSTPLLIATAKFCKEFPYLSNNIRATFDHRRELAEEDEGMKGFFDSRFDRRYPNLIEQFESTYPNA